MSLPGADHARKHELIDVLTRADQPVPKEARNLSAAVSSKPDHRRPSTHFCCSYTMIKNIILSSVLYQRETRKEKMGRRVGEALSPVGPLVAIESSLVAGAVSKPASSSAAAEPSASSSSSLSSEASSSSSSSSSSC